MAERSDSFRDFVKLRRFGFTPTITFSPDDKTRFTVAYEFFRDRRTADRGITSFQGKPADVPISTYYGNPDDSRVRADVNLVSGTFERDLGGLIVRDRAMYGDYDRSYQNYVPGAANAAGTLVILTAYNNATRRKNLFNQTDLIYSAKTGSIRHTLLSGFEFGQQRNE
jgi:catecholate siderophore receptor